MNLYNKFTEVKEKHAKNSCMFNDIDYSYLQIFNQVNKFSLVLGDKIDNALLAICIKKSHHVIIAQLAANKKDKCFLPLDVDNFNRNKLIIEDAKPHWILLQNSEEYNNYAFNNNYVLLKKYNEDANLWVNNKYRIYPDECKYVIYSSG